MRLLLMPAALAAACALHAQRVNKPFDKEHFPDAPALKEALAALRTGRALFEEGGCRLPDAFRAYEKALAFNPDNADLNLRMGLCLLNGRQPHRSLPYFQAAYELDPATPRIHFLLGMGYHLNAEWDKATEEYRAHKASLHGMPDQELQYNTADQRIAECRNGKSLQGHPVNAQLSQLGPAVNSEAADYGVTITPDDAQLFFTSRRSGSTGGKMNKATGEPFEDIYRSIRTPQGWSSAEPCAVPLNSDINDACVGLFQDGATLIVFRDRKGTGDLFLSRNVGGSWTEPLPLPPSINSSANETSAWVSPDGKLLYFVSDREGGLGGQDIWMSRWVADEQTWGEPENLGPTVNSKEDEDGVFLEPDGHTMYFSSRGHLNMGGFDVFRSTMVGKRWGKPVNMGWPVNSPEDELFFVLTANGSTGYLSSVRPNGLGEDDLYRVDLLPEAERMETASMAGAALPDNTPGGATVLLKGHVKSKDQPAGTEARIELTELRDTRRVASVGCDPATGAFLLVAPGARNYAVHVRRPGHLFHSAQIFLPDGAASLERTMDATLQPLAPGASEVMWNIFFEPGQTMPTPASLGELGQLLRLLNEHPGLRLEVGGFADAGGAPTGPVQGDLARAQAVVDHLVNNGVAANRLMAKGLASSKRPVPSGPAGDAHRAGLIRITVL